MHSKIFGLTRIYSKSVYEHNEDDVYEAMGYNADYVIKQQGADYLESWQWLGTAYSEFMDVRREFKNNKIHYYIIFNLEQLHNYIVRDYESFKSMVDNISLTDFTYGQGMKMYELEQKLHNTTGFWVIDTYVSYVELTPFNEWIRYVYRYMVENSIGELEYEITEIFDYHN